MIMRRYIAVIRGPGSHGLGRLSNVNKALDDWPNTLGPWGFAVLTGTHSCIKIF
jgi:hypothetical protein